jgi:tRNA(Arg) A34 adenosine deaminase TadA
MRLVARFWNGNKHGQGGSYPWRTKQKLPSGIYSGGQYLGHNIACIAVDGCGEVIDFDFNHNDIFSSSVEHAESRLVRRVFSLAQVYDDWYVKQSAGFPQSHDYATILSNVTLYTSLESCAQCSGIMALGQVKSVVYLQHDPGQFLIGNILRNLTTPSLRAPLPISADKFGFAYYSALNDGFKDFYSRVPNEPFYVSDSTPDTAQSITSFLCTDNALAIFQKAIGEFKTHRIAFPEFRPPDTRTDKRQALTNEEVRNHVVKFYEYASACGKRGTPHKL